jgi:predicted anti-sigma-YlaC factor YlaD
MHRIIRDHLEEVLAGAGSAPEHPAVRHLAECEECRQGVAAMREQGTVLREFRNAGEAEPRPGFYARVMDRIEAQAPLSVWTLFFDSLFGSRIALASLGLALLIGVYVVSSEQSADPQIAAVNAQPEAVLVSDFPQGLPGGVFSDNTQPHMVAGAPDQDTVLVNLVTYREQ